MGEQAGHVHGSAVRGAQQFLEGLSLQHRLQFHLHRIDYALGHLCRIIGDVFSVGLHREDHEGGQGLEIGSPVSDLALYGRFLEVVVCGRLSAAPALARAWLPGRRFQCFFIREHARNGAIGHVMAGRIYCFP